MPMPGWPLRSLQGRLLAWVLGGVAAVWLGVAALTWFDVRQELDELLDTPVRQLSLGQRMRCDIAASLLHQPPLLFLDDHHLPFRAQAPFKVWAPLSDAPDSFVFFTPGRKLSAPTSIEKA